MGGTTFTPAATGESGRGIICRYNHPGKDAQKCQSVSFW